MDHKTIIFVITTILLNADLFMSHKIHSNKASKQQRLLLVSFDGFRYDYIDKYNLKNFKKVLNDGVKASYLKPQFSTQTYPNHWTLVTGMYQESHGIVGNTFFDPLYNELFIRNDTNLKWWNATEPIWFTAARNNIKSGTYFWPGSQVIYFDTPMYTFIEYDEKLPFKPKVDKVVEWFTKENFVFATIYDPQPDYNGHFFGLDSDVFNKTIAQVDEDLGYLISELEKANLYDADDFNLIVVSDHGMANTYNLVLLDQYVTSSDVGVLAAGGNNIHLKILPNTNIDQVLAKLNKLPNVTVLLKDQIPDRWHFKNNRRVGDILLVAQEGTGLYRTNTTTYYLADHGYDNNVVNVRANFMAKGALFKKGYQSQDYIENVDVYPLLCYILNINPLPNNGSLDNMKQFLDTSTSSASIIFNSYSVSLFIIFSMLFNIFKLF